MQIQIQNKKLVKTTKRRNRQYRTDEQTRRESRPTNTSIQKVQNYTIFKQTTKVIVNKLLHSTYGVSVTKSDLYSSLTDSQYGSAGYTNRKICHKTYLQHIHLKRPSL